jgi:hypothetical protein
MTENAQQYESEIERLRAFELRMQTEGADGFANGPEPWTNWQETDSEAGNQAWEHAPRSEPEPAGKTLCEKLLPTMASIAVATLAVGIGGVYMSMEDTPLVAVNSIQPAPALQVPEQSPEGQVIRSTQLAVATVPAIAMTETPNPDELLQAEVTPGQADSVVLDTASADGMADIAATVPAPTDIASADKMTEIAATVVPPPTDIASADEMTDIAATLPAPAAGEPVTVSMITPHVAATDTRPAVQAAVTPAPANDGTWVVNISSYRYESMARRKLAEFRQKGVTAEISAVTIDDRPMYRIRTTGYDNYKEAKTWVSLLEDRLGVDSAWVSKHE